MKLRIPFAAALVVTFLLSLPHAGFLLGQKVGNKVSTFTPCVVVGTVTGNVTGDVVGNVTGNLTGNTSGNLTANKISGATLSNGLNSNIAITTGFVRITNPSAVFSVGGFTPTADGTILRIMNTVNFTMTVVNEDASSTVGNRIKTLTGSNVVLRTNLPSSATFIYSTTDSRWILTGTN